MPKGLRLSARLDPELAKKLNYLRRRTRATTTEVVRRSIDHYYRAVSSEDSDVGEAIEATGFIGCGEGPVDLSDRYKAELGASLSKKS